MLKEIVGRRSFWLRAASQIDAHPIRFSFNIAILVHQLTLTPTRSGSGDTAVGACSRRDRLSPGLHRFVEDDRRWQIFGTLILGRAYKLEAQFSVHVTPRYADDYKCG